MNGRGENIISDLPSCLKWKKYCRVSKSMLIHQAIRRHIIHHIATTEILKDLSTILEVILSNICTHTYTYTHLQTHACLFAMLIIWLSHGGFLLVDLAIEHENRIVAHEKAGNS